MEVVAVEEGAEVTAEIVEIAEVVILIQTSQSRLRPEPPASVGPSTQIFQPVSGKAAGCIIAGGGGLISVQNPLHVHGRIFTLQSQQNEIQTSSARK